MSELVVKKTDSIFDEIQSMQDRIMKRAYEIFDLNGNPGADLDNWLAAERELIWKPAVELSEKNNIFNVNVEMAGVDPKNVVIEVTPEELLVKAETREEKKEEKDKVYTSELKTGSLFRSIRFPKKVDTDKVKAEFKNGLLKITASIAEGQEAKKVSIQAA
jgi:HSP20 family protein